MANPISAAVPAAAASISSAESSNSAVSWGAIIAGAVGATVLTLLLTLLGSGLGLSMVSPFGNQGASATTFAVSTAVGIVLIQWISSAFGGYLTGRLRTKWSGIHNDEAFFRDTAHGFLAWALATLVAVGMLGSVLSSTIGTGVQAAASLTGTAAVATAGAAANSDQAGDAASYFVDTLMRPADPRNVPAGQNTQDATREISRILLNGATTGTIPEGDRTYLSQLVAARTGLSEADANARVDSVLKSIEDAKVKAQEAAETARKASATTALAGSIALLLGALCAGVGAALGGRQRDDVNLYVRR